MKLKSVLVCAFFIFCCVTLVFAETITKTIKVTYDDIKINVNGKRVYPDSDPFIYNGKTFVPLRFIGEALDKDVIWDKSTKTIGIFEKSGWKKVADFTNYNTRAGMNDDILPQTKNFSIKSNSWKVTYTVIGVLDDLSNQMFALCPRRKGGKCLFTHEAKFNANYFSEGEFIVSEGKGDFNLIVMFSPEKSKYLNDIDEIRFKVTVYEKK